MKKIIVNRTDLLKTLSIAGTMATKNNALPILENIKCMVSENSMRIVSFNGEVAVSKGCPIMENEGEMSFCINARDFISYVKLITDETITIGLSCDDSMTCEISHSKGKTTIPYLDAVDFPTPNKESEYTRASIDGSILSNVIQVAQRFVGHDAIRPVMESMYLEINDGVLCYCASDSHILVTESINIGGNNAGNVNVLLHSSSFRPLIDVLRDSSEVSLTIGTQTLVARNKDASINCRLVDGSYPNFKSIIPSSFKIVIADIPTGDVVSAVERCALSSSVNKMIKFDFIAGKGLEVSCQNLEFGKNAKEFIPCEVESDITIGFNSDYVLSALGSISDDKFTMNMNSESHAAIIKDSNLEKNILIMPVRLQN